LKSKRQARGPAFLLLSEWNEQLLLFALLVVLLVVQFALALPLGSETLV
jgi:hypothetical protein